MFYVSVDVRRYIECVPGVCPLEEYLFALSYLSRLGPALEGYRREH
uniref:Uncharacterized protein n=1 Tax=Parascaris equorum TaxID=6256 RepID=A0A914S5Q7_PAREQ